jgi:hypothetical protein
MKFRFAKCLNSIKQCKLVNFLQTLFMCCSKKDSAVYNTSNNSSTSKKYSLKKEFKLIYYTLCYNENNDAVNTIETLLAPIAEYFSSIIRWFGRVGHFLHLITFLSNFYSLFIKGLVLLVWVLTLNMLCCFYYVIVPQLLLTKWYVFCVHFIMGNWLAVNTFFHWIMGLFVGPGYPPTVCL